MAEILKSQEIWISRKESNFDRACDAAYDQAIQSFGVDDCGHSRIEGWQRSRCWIQVSFKRYLHVGSMSGHSYQYWFLAEAMKGEDE